jgi:hypothetical protein
MNIHRSNHIISHKPPPLSSFPAPFLSFTHLNGSATSKSRLVIAMLGPVNKHATSRDQPKKRIRQIDPNGILHSADSIVVIACADVHLAEDTEEGDPKDEEDGVPNEEEWDARGKGDDVECCRDGGQGGCYFCEDLKGVC